MHFLMMPFVVATWVKNWFWAFIFAFIQVFILWSLNFIAVEIENPFGTDANDLDGKHMQLEINRQLAMLLQPETICTPQLSENAVWSADPKRPVYLIEAGGAQSFHECWHGSIKVEQKSTEGKTAYRSGPAGKSTSLGFSSTSMAAASISADQKDGADGTETFAGFGTGYASDSMTPQGSRGSRKIPKSVRQSLRSAIMAEGRRSNAQRDTKEASRSSSARSQNNFP